MSSLTFRSRPLDNSKPMPVIEATVPLENGVDQMLNTSTSNVRSSLGMEKEEENEVHLLSAIEAQKKDLETSYVIPTPDVRKTGLLFDLRNILVPNYLIGYDNEQNDESSPPQYDLDSEDQEFLINYNSNVSELNKLDEINLERMMETMEVFYSKTFDIEKVLERVKSDDIPDKLYKHWKEKRANISQDHLLIPVVRTLDRVKKNDPHVAFRKRAEKMQTRKNRKEEEVYFEGALRMQYAMETMLRIIDDAFSREVEKMKLEMTTIEGYIYRCNHPSKFQRTVDNLMTAADSESKELGVKCRGMGLERSNQSTITIGNNCEERWKLWADVSRIEWAKNNSPVKHTSTLMSYGRMIPCSSQILYGLQEIPHKNHMYRPVRKRPIGVHSSKDDLIQHLFENSCRSRKNHEFLYEERVYNFLQDFDTRSKSFDRGFPKRKMRKSTRDRLSQDW